MFVAWDSVADRYKKMLLNPTSVGCFSSDATTSKCLLPTTTADSASAMS